MARTATITDEQILDAAREVFLAEGFGASTARIAQRAGVSEGSIFKRFATKEALFYAALEIDPEPAWHAEVSKRVGQGDSKENLIQLSLSILLYFNAMLARMITKMGSHPTPATFKGLPEHPIVKDRIQISTYIQQEIDLGRLRPCDSNLLAGMLLGSLSHHVFTAMIVGRPLDEAELVPIATGVVEILWGGIAPHAPRS